MSQKFQIVCFGQWAIELFDKIIKENGSWSLLVSKQHILDFFSEIFWIKNSNFIDLYEEPINGEILYRAVLDISQYPQISVTEGTVVGLPDWQKTATKLILKQNHFLSNTLAHETAF